MNGDLIWAVVRTLVALPLVLGLAYLVLKYGLARRYTLAPGNHRLKLVEQLPLGPKTVLSLVALGGKYYLLAHQDNSISLIKEMDELPDPVEAKVGEIVELTPHTIKEFDQLQKDEDPGSEGRLPEVLARKYGRQLKILAGRAVRVRESLTARLAPRARTDKKGEKKVEG